MKPALVEKFMAYRKQARLLERRLVLKAPADRLWPYLTHLRWLHQQPEIPVKNYTLLSSEAQPRIQMQLVGQTFVCEEMPCEWQTPRFFRYEWLVLKGPCRYLGWILKLKTKGEITQVQLSLGWGPAQTMAKPEKLLLPYLDALELVFKKVESYVLGAPGSERLFQDARGEQLVFSEDVQTQWQNLSTQPQIPESLARYMFQYPNFTYPQLNPVKIAALFELPLWELVLFFIRGVQADAFKVHFHLLAPDLTQEKKLVLSDLRPQMASAKYQQNYTVLLDRHLVLTFLSQLRLVEQSHIMGRGETPGFHPEIDWQMPILPGQRRAIKAPPKGVLNLSFPSLLTEGRVDISRAGQAQGRWRLQAQQTLESLRLQPGANLVLENTGAMPCVFQRQQPGISAAYLTLGQLLSIQQIRDVWPGLQLPAEQRFQLARQTLLSVALNPLPDACLSDFYALLAFVTTRFYGAMVQRQQGTVLMSFPDPLQGLKGALWLLQQLRAWQDVGTLLREAQSLVALHTGPCMLISGPRPRYLGHAVRQVMEHLERSQGGDVILSPAVYETSEIQAYLANYPAQVIQFFPQPGGLDVDYLIQVLPQN